MKIFCRRILIIFLIIVIINGNPVERQSKILRGRNALPGEFPYTVSLVLEDHHHLCGGSIITKKHILTAAHCFVGLLEPPYTKGLTVLTGAVNRRNDGEIHHILKITPHNNFESGNKARWRNDIAVMTLADEIKITKFQLPIALPKSRTPGNVIGVLSGWGYPAMNTDVKEILQTRKVRIITNEDCNGRNADISNKQLCGFDGHATGFCSGDSGGPLVYNNEVVGIVSFSVACGIGSPDIYTRVDSYLDFINKIISVDY